MKNFFVRNGYNLRDINRELYFRSIFVDWLQKLLFFWILKVIT